jgi:hypothetical protein
LNLPPDKYSDGLRRRLAGDVAVMSFDEALDRLDQTSGGHLPKRQSEQVVVKMTRDFEAFYETRRANEPEAGADLLVLTLDAKGIVMRQEDLREATRQAAQRTEPERQARLSPQTQRHRKRMATVASVYTVAPYTRRPESILNPDNDEEPRRPNVVNKRVWASEEPPPPAEPICSTDVAGEASPLLPMTAPRDASSAPKTLLNRPIVIAARKKTTR